MGNPNRVAVESSSSKQTNIPAQQRKWWALAVLAAGLAMIVIDGTIVAVALPTVIGALDLDLTQAQWVNSLYSVVFAALLLTSGHLGDRFGRRRMFLVGLLLFVVGSVLAAMATAASGLIWARVVQGLGAACVLPATLSTVNATFRGTDRAAAFGVWGATMSGAAALGPLLGGWLTQSFSWEWIFLVNVPIGVVLFLAALVVVPETRSDHTERGFDVNGLLLSAIGFGALVFAIIEGSDLGWWSPVQDFSVFGFTWPQSWPVSIVPPMLLAAVVALVLFLVWEHRRVRALRSRLLDLRLFREATFSWGNLTAMMVAVGEFGLIFVLPLYLKNVAALSTLHVGFVLAAMAFGAFLSGAAARHVATAVGPSGTVLIGLLIEVLGIGILALFVSATTPIALVTTLLAVYGVGLGLASAQLTSTILRDIPTAESGQGSATQSTVRQIGTALGTAIMGAVLSVSLQHTLTGNPTVPPHLADATRMSAGGTIDGLRGTPGSDQVVAVLSDAFATATQWTMLGATAFLFLGLIGALQVRRHAAAGDNA